MLYNKILSWDIKYSTQQTQSRFWDWVKGTAFICVSAYSLCLLSGLWTTERWQSCSGQSKRPKEHSHKQWIFLSKTWRRIWWPCRDKVGFPGGSAVKNLPLNAGNLGLISGLGRSPGGGNGNHSRILAWRIPWTEGPGGLQSGSQRVRHDWCDFAPRTIQNESQLLWTGQILMFICNLDLLERTFMRREVAIPLKSGPRMPSSPSLTTCLMVSSCLNPPSFGSHE